MTGRMLDETLGKVHFWLTFIGFHLTFLALIIHGGCRFRYRPCGGDLHLLF
jgi:heme/copper-type cytochrome/quinol oxidase subunit 1